MYFLAVLCLVSAAAALPIDNHTPPPAPPHHIEEKIAPEAHNKEGLDEKIVPVEDIRNPAEKHEFKEPKPQPIDDVKKHFEEAKKGEDFKEPKEDKDFKESKKDEDKEFKKDKDFKESKQDEGKEINKDKNAKESNKDNPNDILSPGIVIIEEDKNANDGGFDQPDEPIVTKKPSKLSGLLDWVFNLFHLNRSHGARSGFEGGPEVDYNVDPNDRDVLNGVLA